MVADPHIRATATDPLTTVTATYLLTTVTATIPQTATAMAKGYMDICLSQTL